MKPMSVLKKECSNYDKILLKSENGFLCLCFGFYEDGMIRIENTYNYQPLSDFISWMPLTDLMKLID